jgi:hypothetical protein
MAKSEDRQARRESLEHELQNVRSMIRALREAAGNAQPEHGVMFELERAEEKEIEILEALAALDGDPDSRAGQRKTRSRRVVGRGHVGAEKASELKTPFGAIGSKPMRNFFSAKPEPRIPNPPKKTPPGPHRQAGLERPIAYATCSGALPNIHETQACL